MFYINKDTLLDAALLQKMISKFRISIEPKLSKYKRYYGGEHAILQKHYGDATKPCNKTIINYCKNIVDAYCGYLATPGHISYTSDNDIEEIMDILRYNDHQEEDAEFLMNALIYGVAAELMYNDNSGKTRFRTINPMQCFGIWDDSLTNDLLYFVRIYKANDWDESDLYKVDVYTDTDIKHYKMNGANGNLTFESEERHYFNQCPANIFILPDEKSIFDCILSQQDSINELLSAEIDDYSAFVDSYMLLSGVDAEDEDIAAMKANRVLVLPEGATAAYLTKASNDAQVENILKRIHDSIYRIAQCPDFSSESFVGGVSSGIAIRYRLTGMETRAGIIEGLMKKALQRRVEIICGIASLKLGEEIFRDIKIEFSRNVPTDNTDVINLVNALKGTVSDETLLAQLPFVDDVNAEIKRIEEQKKANMAIYEFNSHAEI